MEMALGDVTVVMQQRDETLAKLFSALHAAMSKHMYDVVLDELTNLCVIYADKLKEE
jgi:hypothetical protein